MRRQALDPASGEGVVDVTDRVVALRGWPANLADLAINVRQGEPEPGALERALEAGEVIRSYAFRGGSYVFAPEIGSVGPHGHWELGAGAIARFVRRCANLGSCPGGASPASPSSSAFAPTTP